MICSVTLQQFHYGSNQRYQIILYNFKVVTNNTIPHELLQATTRSLLERAQYSSSIFISIVILWTRFENDKDELHREIRIFK